MNAAALPSSSSSSGPGMRSPAIRRSVSRASRITTSPTPHPYLDSSTCRCSSCHLKSAIFPRRTDGKIVLPRPGRPPRQGGGNSYVSIVRLSSDLALSFFFVGGGGRDLKNRKRHRPLDLDHDDGDGNARGKGKNRAVNGDGLFKFFLSRFIDLPHGG